ncbi:MAG: LacI family DNA-binding transcriptional regulator [Lachnospiraceae bacterium]
MAATVKDIAKHTGLGLATISSYLNGGHVREGNRIKIEEAIADLHFEVNEVARGLKTNSTKTIGVVIPELNSIFCAQIITAMEDILRTNGYATMICDCRTNKELEKEAVEFLLRKRVDGIINMPVNSDGSHLEGFLNSGRPIVLIDRKINGLDCDSILVDNLTASREAVTYLIERGHRNIGIISGPDDIFTAQERLVGYRLALMEAGIEPKDSLVEAGDFTINGGSLSLKELIRRNPDMTAVFVTNYEMTMGAVIGANELGIRMPNQLSMIGFDHAEFAKACNPRLTIVTQPMEEIARHVADLILKRINEKDRELRMHEVLKLQTKLLEGESVANLNIE